MLDTLQAWDAGAFLWLNGQHSEWLDATVPILTSWLGWVPIFAFLAALAWRSRGIFWTLSLALSIGAGIGLTDAISSRVIKPEIARPRPSHHPELAPRAHFVNNYMGGAYGFVSSHAANSLVVALIGGLALGRRYRWLWGILLVWALLQGYTRVYLGVHYPGDILGGYVLAMPIGVGVGYLRLRIFR